MVQEGFSVIFCSSCQLHVVQRKWQVKLAVSRHALHSDSFNLWPATYLNYCSNFYFVNQMSVVFKFVSYGLLTAKLDSKRGKPMV